MEAANGYDCIGRYSIGTGKPLVIDISLMDSLVSLMHMRMQREGLGGRIASLEEILTAKLELYILLYRTVSQTASGSAVTERAIQSMEAWNREYNGKGKTSYQSCNTLESRMLISIYDVLHRLYHRPQTRLLISCSHPCSLGPNKAVSP